MNKIASYKSIENCRFCGSSELFEYLDLGDQPPSNLFLTIDQIPAENSYPLKVLLCESCSASQLSYVVPPEEIFSDYDYLSSTSKALQLHFQRLINSILKTGKFEKNIKVLDIGANDGIILDQYPKNNSYNLLGVEPSTAGNIAKKKGYHIYCDFFNEKVATSILNDWGTIDIITATNVFAHVHDVRSFIENVAKLLSSEGLFVLEFPYTPRTFDNLYFDTIYHEHLSYLNLTCLEILIKKTELNIIDVKLTEIGASGPAIQILIAKKEASYSSNSSVIEFLLNEKKWGVKDRDKYLSFAAKVAESKQKILNIIETCCKQKGKIAAFSAPAKGNTLLNYLNLTSSNIECIAETNERKIGKITPGTHIPVIDEKSFLKMNFPYALLLSWNYVDFFLQNSLYIQKGGKFIVPLPEPRVLG